ncbi:carotenoid cleavage dioxygenase [Sphingobium sp. B1D7B]|uniref:carotenoid oxygenase family protein n=1 Tax=unclassified Sphingobium TaxID=2611147 RepID=UPI00222401E4|nr:MULTISPECIES: carotenoid oxygenase family protein [unclassified Sphingobium]MCW2391651.1 carotenoid cleavage dioxygenase [Sphingobium sp. B11D3A]MCW2403406.1 carotenoid cleavage dioxygenase [Sphingobium sp. B1D7B]
MVDFSSDPAKRGFFSAQRYDAEILECEVQGTLPADLVGTFVRLGGEWYYPPSKPDDAMLHTDGYVSTFRFKDGRVSYKGKFVRTPRFQANLKAGRQLFGYYRNRFTDDPSVQGIDGTVSNTTPLVHGGKLFTLKEDSLPQQIDPVTLDTIGAWDFDGKYKSQTFTAHPKIDPFTGEMIAYGYEATGPASKDVFVYAMDKAGRVTRETRFEVPYVSVMHDIALTEKHILFPFGGYVTSMERLREGKVHWGWDRSKDSYIGIMPRDGDGKDIRWFKGPERCMMHTFNAQTIGNKVVFYAPFYDSNFFPFFPNVDGSPWDPTRAKAYVRRLTFDLNSKKDSWEEEILFPLPIGDLGRIDPRYLTQENRYCFTGFTDPTRPFDEARAGNLRGRVTNSYARFDLHTNKVDRYFPGDTHSLQECTFIPRSADAPEGDGYLIGTASNYAEMRSELIIADAQRLEEGDIARVILPFRAGPQVHGIWVRPDELAPFPKAGGIDA